MIGERRESRIDQAHHAYLAHEATGESNPRRFQPYPAYKDSGVEWLGEIPEQWEIAPCTLGTRLHWQDARCETSDREIPRTLPEEHRRPMGFREYGRAP